MADQEQQLTNRQKWEQGLRRKYPEQSFENEDDLFAASMNGYDQEHDTNKRFVADNKKLYEILNSNPGVSLFISALMGGESPARAFSYLQEQLDGLSDGDEAFNEEYLNAVNEYKKQRESEAAHNEKVLANKESAAQSLKDFAAEKGMDENQLAEFMSKVEEFLTGIANLEISHDFLDMIYNYINRESDLSTAKEIGRVQGRNEKIDAQKAKTRNTDSLPDLPSGSGTIVPEKEDEGGTFLDGALKNYERRHRNI